MPIIATKVKVEIGSTFGTSKTINSISKASTAVINSTAHGFANGDWIWLESVEGMIEMRGRLVRAAGVTTDTFQAEGVDSTSFATFTAGTCKKVTAFVTASEAADIQSSGGDARTVDTSVLLDDEDQEEFVSNAPVRYNLTNQFAVSSAAQALASSLSDTNAQAPFKITFKNLNIITMAATINAPEALTINRGQVVTTPWSLAKKSKFTKYVS